VLGGRGHEDVCGTGGTASYIVNLYPTERSVNLSCPLGQGVDLPPSLDQMDMVGLGGGRLFGLRMEEF